MSANHQRDDILEHAVEALRDSPVPDGPPPQVRDTTLAALHAGAPPRPLRITPHVRPAIVTWARVAAVVVLALAGGLMIFFATRRSPSTDVGRGPTGADRLPVPPPAPPSTRDAVRPGTDGGPRPAPETRPSLPQPPPEVPGPALAAALPIQGVVMFDGKPPARKPLDMSSVPDCQRIHGQPVLDESLVVAAGGQIRNVVVSVSAGLPPMNYAPPSGPVVLDQKGCVFVPHVIAMRTGQSLVASNSDPFLHNVRAQPQQNPPFNIAQPTVERGTPLKTPQAPEVFKIHCNVHRWMSAWVAVFDHPYFAVTGDDGSFKLPVLPPGKYTIRAWHETLGTQEREVTVEAGKTPEVRFAFVAPVKEE
jgi:hypothetical protein